MEKIDAGCIVVGAGLSGGVVARHLAEQGRKVVVWERRNHIGGNMFDYRDEYGILVQKYGPHTFHTKCKQLYNYMQKFEMWNDYKLTCMAEIDGIATPTPFNFQTVDDFYSDKEAAQLKKKLQEAFAEQSTATVVEVLEHPDETIRSYARFLFEKDYAPYTAKQWGVSPAEIDVSVLKRVPLRFSYEIGYFDDDYQVMPVHSFTHFFEQLFNHPNITVELHVDALERLKADVQNHCMWLGKEKLEIPVVYTGAIDELFALQEGPLPYRSLRFEWKHDKDTASLQNAPVVAYPQAEGYTRITEYKKLPVQEVQGTSYAVEYPCPYQQGERTEPYYPVLTAHSQEQYQRYRKLAQSIENLYLCGRLADFKYYNMDQALKKALEMCTTISKH